MFNLVTGFIPTCVSRYIKKQETAPILEGPEVANGKHTLFWTFSDAFGNQMYFAGLFKLVRLAAPPPFQSCVDKATPV
jgi:hypothetical protein